MNTKLVTILLNCCLTIVTQHTELNMAANGIYFSDTDFINHHLHLPFNKKEAIFKSPIGHFHELWIKTKDSTYKFFDDEIWGYRQNNEDYRIVRGDFYKIVSIDKIVLYTIPSTPGNLAGTIFFSKDLSAPVYYLSKRNLREVYHADTAFVERIKQMRLTQSIFRKNKKNNRFEFIDWIK